MRKSNLTCVKMDSVTDCQTKIKKNGKDDDPCYW